MGTKKPTDQMKADLIGGVRPYVRHADSKNTQVNKPARTPLNGLTPTGNLARPKNGGRQAGSKNKKEVSEAMLADILSVYQQLGGVKFLLQYAKNNPGDFVKTVLARLMPTPYTEPADAPPVNVNILSEHSPDYLFDAARHVAFALAQGAEAAEKLTGKTIEAEPVKAESKPVKTEPATLDPPPVAPAPYLPDDAAPIETLQEIAEKAVARELVADTIRCNISNYPGGSSEQGISRKKRS